MVCASLKLGFPFLVCLFLVNIAEGGELVGTVTHVRDADTIEVNGVPIRLNGVSAPELDTAIGRRGKEFMKNLVSHKQVICQLNGKATHDRLVGVCFLNGQDIAIHVIKAGYAVDCPRYSNGRYEKFETLKARQWRLPRYCKVW